MTAHDDATTRLAEWISLGAAVLFVGVGILALKYPETAILRLATLGVPGWPVYLAGIAEIVAGGMLLYRPARVGAAIVLAIATLAGAGLSMAYREGGTALEGLGLAVLACIVLVLERRRS